VKLDLLENTLRTIILLATVAFVLALCLDIFAPGAGVAPQASPYALAPASLETPIEGRAAYVDSTHAGSPGRPGERKPAAP
jgi:hypothetical protein